MAKIGLCEDDPAIRRVVLAALKHAGHVGVPAHLMFIDRLYYFEQDLNGA